MNQETKPCFVCDKKMCPIFKNWSTLQPDDGAEVIITASYGSKFDTSRFYGIICDECIEQNIHRLRRKEYRDF